MFDFPWVLPRILVLAMLFATGMISYHLGVFVPKALAVRAIKGLGNGYSFGNDSYPIWLTSREVLYHRNTYSGGMTLAKSRLARSGVGLTAAIRAILQQTIAPSPIRHSRTFYAGPQPHCPSLWLLLGSQ